MVLHVCITSPCGHTLSFQYPASVHEQVNIWFIFTSSSSFLYLRCPTFKPNSRCARRAHGVYHCGAGGTGARTHTHLTFWYDAGLYPPLPDVTELYRRRLRRRARGKTRLRAPCCREPRVCGPTPAPYRARTPRACAHWRATYTPPGCAARCGAAPLRCAVRRAGAYGGRYYCVPLPPAINSPRMTAAAVPARCVSFLATSRCARSWRNSLPSSAVGAPLLHAALERTGRASRVVTPRANGHWWNVLNSPGRFVMAGVFHCAALSTISLITAGGVLSSSISHHGHRGRRTPPLLWCSSSLNNYISIVRGLCLGTDVCWGLRA